MQLTKHRDVFTLNMSSDDLVFLVNNLGSDPVSVEAQERNEECSNLLAKVYFAAADFNRSLAGT